jgi:alpha-tubulin suppressor-like RCC1 family protein
MARRKSHIAGPAQVERPQLARELDDGKGMPSSARSFLSVLAGTAVLAGTVAGCSVPRDPDLLEDSDAEPADATQDGVRVEDSSGGAERIDAQVDSGSSLDADRPENRFDAATERDVVMVADARADGASDAGIVDRMDAPNETTTADVRVDSVVDASRDAIGDATADSSGNFDAVDGRICTGGTTYCSASTLRACSADGTTSTVLDTCATPELCAASTTGTTCVPPACAVGETKCTGSVLQTCNAGQTGFNDTTTCTAVCSPTGCLSVRQMSAGGDYTCAVLSDGSVRCWGILTTIGTTLEPTPIADVNGATAVSVAPGGGSHACALTGGSVRCWGRNNSSELGTPGQPSASGLLVPSITTAVEAFAGQDMSCARLADGSGQCWGSNAAGQLGNGATDSPMGPVAVAGVSGANALFIGPDTGCVRLSSDQSLLCWGFNNYGEIGLGMAGTAVRTPTASPTIAGAKQVGWGNGHGIALMTDGSVKTWGTNASGQLGDGSTTVNYSPTTIAALANISAVATGFLHNCVIMADASLKCWGGNSTGQILPTGTMYTTPTVVPGIVGVVEVVTANGHTCARVADGTVSCWGRNAGGQLGDKSTVDHKTPAPVKW